MHRQALEEMENVLRLEHLDTLTNASNLRLVLNCQGKHKEAEGIYQQALKGREKILNLKYLDTLTSVNNLGLVLWKQGKYKEAEAMN